MAPPSVLADAVMVNRLSGSWPEKLPRLSPWFVGVTGELGRPPQIRHRRHYCKSITDSDDVRVAIFWASPATLLVAFNAVARLPPLVRRRRSTSSALVVDSVASALFPLRPRRRRGCLLFAPAFQHIVG